MKTTIPFIVLFALAISSHSHADIILNPIEDLQTVERTTTDGPYTSNGPTTNTVNFAWHGKSYLKFDLSGISDLSQVTSMSLRLYETTNSWNYSPDIIDLYYTNDHSWNESSSFQEVPSHTGDLIHQVNHTAGWNNWVTWDMSSYDLINNSVDDTLTLVLENNQGGNWNMTTFISGDNEQSEFWPQLVLVPEPSSILFGVLAAIGTLARRGRQVRRFSSACRSEF